MGHLQRLKKFLGVMLTVAHGDMAIRVLASREPLVVAKTPISVEELDRKARQLRREVMAFHAWPPDMPSLSLESFRATLRERYQVEE